jgi:hypothetical protein
LRSCRRQFSKTDSRRLRLRETNRADFLFFLAAVDITTRSVSRRSAESYSQIVLDHRTL